MEGFAEVGAGAAQHGEDPHRQAGAGGGACNTTVVTVVTEGRRHQQLEQCQ